MINLDVSPQETTGYKAETNRLLKRSHEVKAQLEGIKCTTPMKETGIYEDYVDAYCTCLTTNQFYVHVCQQKFQ